MTSLVDHLKDDAEQLDRQAEHPNTDQPVFSDSRNGAGERYAVAGFDFSHEQNVALGGAEAR